MFSIIFVWFCNLITVNKHTYILAMSNCLYWVFCDTFKDKLPPDGILLYSYELSFFINYGNILRISTFFWNSPSLLVMWNSSSTCKHFRIYLLFCCCFLHLKGPLSHTDCISHNGLCVPTCLWANMYFFISSNEAFHHLLSKVAYWVDLRIKVHLVFLHR